MRLIDADALIEMIDSEYQDIDRQDMKMMVNNAPTLDYELAREEFKDRGGCWGCQCDRLKEECAEIERHSKK